jgi:hypothetical protein
MKTTLRKDQPAEPARASGITATNPLALLPPAHRQTKPLQGLLRTALLPGQATNPLQRIASYDPPRPAEPNRTGLPDGLKAGIETRSGYGMDDVRVHYPDARSPVRW